MMGLGLQSQRRHLVAIDSFQPHLMNHLHLFEASTAFVAEGIVLSLVKALEVIEVDWTTYSSLLLVSLGITDGGVADLRTIDGHVTCV